ncbi:MAG TPA: GTP cyclohydrolase I FolE [Planctomycetota bacterium]|nr:GTP cyclohydrolase I FolE [Planctomycetota bacterium]MDP6128332.1 GTP cyclohydrolase I FolE [Planctomycetota bacterium]MDP7245118.1 GTP cyclohydrolase I FolE [Planctomycetota bacterium]HJM38719.1 GTP cyclohydrolase I FolE [Planctomycetota bacterium]|tara:strand:+ start:48565 stop:49146 length:582 start_codon:yes stop_codon:yes gene_type:complete
MNTPTSLNQRKDSTMESLVEAMLEQIGEDPKREGLLKTPQRVTETLADLTNGYQRSLEETVNGAIFHEDASEMVLVKDIEFYSLCEHHMLPFFGKIHIGYVPDGRIVGLSKLPRIVEMFARRLQVQERMTLQIAEAIESILSPLGVGVVCEASHLCMMMRGVAKQSSSATSSAMLGIFRSDARTRSEFLSLIR